ncbi:MAG: dockerin type I repeat-containing protein, partial [Erysipelotrichaceae bacterium]|nr:dockerin type I repeat-containing protein [Erysipelotrichaceae bacterium]
NYKDAFGNYGIQMVPKGDKDSGFSRPGCLCSGKLQGKTKQAGNAGTGTTQFTAETWIVIWKAGSLEMGANTPIDSYGDWVAHGGDVTNKEFDYDNYTRVTTWTKDEPWAYEYSLLDFELVLPEDMEPGSYTFDIFRDTVVNTHPSSLFNDSNEAVPDEKRNTLKSKVAFDETVFDYDTEPLTINVTGSPAITTTVSTATTPVTTENVTTKESVTTTANTSTEAAVGTTTTTTEYEIVETTVKPINYIGSVEYNLIPQGKEYTKSNTANNNNSVTVKPGEELTVDWMISEDPGTAGMQIALDFSEVTLVKSILGDAYEAIPQFNDNNPEKPGQVVYAWAKNAIQDCDTEEPIYSFKIKAPEKDGIYSIDLDRRELNKVVPKDETTQYQIDFHGLEIIVGEPGITVVTTTETTDATTVTTTETTDATTVTTTETTDAATVTTTHTTDAATVTTTKTTDAVTETTPAVVTTTAEVTTNGGTHAQTTTTVADVSKVLFGDVDCDGAVRINDVVLLNKYLAKNAQVSPQGLKNADCEYDNQINSKDTTKIKQFLAMFIEQTDLGKQA